MPDPMEARKRAREVITGLRRHLHERGLPLSDDDVDLLEARLAEDILKAALAQEIGAYTRRSLVPMLGSVEDTIRKIAEAAEADT